MEGRKSKMPRNRKDGRETKYLLVERGGKRMGQEKGKSERGHSNS